MRWIHVIVALMVLMCGTCGGQSVPSTKLLDDLRSNDEAVRHRAATELVANWQNLAAPSDLVPELSRLTNTPDNLVRLAALTTLLQIELAHPESSRKVASVRQELFRATGSPDSNTRIYAMQILAITPEIPALELKNTLLRALADNDDKVRRAALRTISMRKISDPETVSTVLSVANARAEVRDAAMDALGVIAPTDPRAVRLFMDSLMTTSAFTKQTALIALAKSGQAGSVALPVLKRIASDPQEQKLIRKFAEDAMKAVEQSK